MSREGGDEGLPPLCVITAGDVLAEPDLVRALEAAARGGARLFQVRERGLPDADYERRFRAIRERLPGDALCLVNRRAHLVAPLDAAGVHVGGSPEEISAARARVPAPRLVGSSAHSAEEAQRAAALGADYVFFSPVWAPASKVSALPAVGLDALRRVCESVAAPVFALGGVTPERAAQCRIAGAAGVAVIGSVLLAPDAERATRELLSAWHAAS